MTAHHGTTVTLTCNIEISSSETVILAWTKLASNPETGSEQYIYVSRDDHMEPVTKTNNPDKYQIEGHYDLVIRDVMFDDAGVYQCRMVLSRQQATANLIVLGKTSSSIFIITALHAIPCDTINITTPKYITNC